jgi:regulator of replication initiation timing
MENSQLRMDIGCLMTENKQLKLDLARGKHENEQLKNEEKELKEALAEFKKVILKKLKLFLGLFLIMQELLCS